MTLIHKYRLQANNVLSVDNTQYNVKDIPSGVHLYLNTLCDNDPSLLQELQETLVCTTPNHTVHCEAARKQTHKLDFVCFRMAEDILRYVQGQRNQQSLFCRLVQHRPPLVSLQQATQDFEVAPDADDVFLVNFTDTYTLHCSRVNTDSSSSIKVLPGTIVHLNNPEYSFKVQPSQASLKMLLIRG